MSLKASKYFRAFLLQCLFSSVSMFALAQGVVIRGKVTDAATGEPLPYANVFVEGRYVGTMTELDGSYELQVTKRADSLSASTLGYVQVTLPLTTEKEQVLNFSLSADAQNLGEVVIEAGENPADVLLRKLIANKDRLNVSNFDALSYEAYTKYEIDLVDFTKDNIDENKLLSRFPHLKDYVDTSSEAGTSVLPVFFVESLSDVYRQTNPEKDQEVVHGMKMSGVQKEDFITNLLSNVDQNLNIYENLMAVMGKNFVSPVADYGLTVYKYTLHIYDTLYIDGEPHLEMTFKPRRKGENTFKGSMLVNIQSYGVRSIDMSLSDDIVIEFIEGLDFQQNFTPHIYTKENGQADTVWVPELEQLKLKFTYYFGGETRVLGKKTKSSVNYTVNQKLPDGVFNAFEKVLIEDDAYTRTDSFWIENRHDTLLTSEAGIYDMVDSLKRTKRFKVIIYSARTLSSGYAPIGPIGIGHVASIFSMNQVEKVRLRLGFKTNRKFSERVQLSGYGAYGFKDNRFKYGGEVKFIVSKRPWHRLQLAARTDIDLQSRHAEEMDNDNVFTLLSKPNVKQRLYNIDEYVLTYDTELHRDLSMYLTARHQRFFPYFDFEYIDEKGDVRTDIINSEVGVRLRWQYKASALPGTFDREAQANRFFAQFRKKNVWPVFTLHYSAGIPKVVQSDMKYHDLGLNIQGDYQFTAKMSWYYNFWIGKIWGTVPYLLLKNPEGNFTYVHNKYYFNNMNLLEFTADEYISMNFQWFFGGMLFDKIPGIKKLGIREVVTSNVFWGNLNEANRNYNSANPIDVAYPIPYVEVGVGIENILKIIRIDYIQRVTHLDKDGIAKWAIYASLFIKI